MLDFLLWASLFLSSIQEQNCQDAPGVLLSGPLNVRVDYNLQHQRIYVTWKDDPSTYRVPDKRIYDVAVLLTHNMKEVYNEDHGRQILYVDHCHHSEIDIVRDPGQSGEAAPENDAGNKIDEGAISSIYSDVPAPHVHYNQRLSKTPPVHSTTSTPHTTGSPSSPSSGTTTQNPLYNLAVQTVLAFPVAQLVEHGVCNARVVGSIPTGGQHRNKCMKCMHSLL
ncbi:uncharacterized protein LOC115149234 isoform X1 [Salmo trutta]|uniref:uncharacterized protein LOC115149234 isoform X1 n=1 Tax=Salmo trutta TaxID=8032 RepID=UPI001130E28F|nr:uncharacterized protein LOC115149234 isoform X1 [Salmo trutta]